MVQIWGVQIFGGLDLGWFRFGVVQICGGLDLWQFRFGVVYIWGGGFDLGFY